MWRCASAAPLVAALLAASVAQADDLAGLAQQRFERGKAMLSQGDAAGALSEFRDSLAMFDSPNTRLLLARALVALGRLDEAVVEYEATVRVSVDAARQAPRYRETGNVAERERRDTESRVARLRFRVEGPAASAPDLTIEVRGRSIPRAAVGLELPLLPGPLVARARAAGFDDAVGSIELVAGLRSELVLVPTARAQDVSLVAAAPPAQPRVLDAPTPPAPAGTADEGWRRWIWAGAGTAAAGGVVFAVSGLLARDRYDTLAAGCAAPSCATAEFASEGRTLQAVANVGLVVAVVGVSAGLGFLIAELSR